MDRGRDKAGSRNSRAVKAIAKTQTQGRESSRAEALADGGASMGEACRHMQDSLSVPRRVGWPELSDYTEAGHPARAAGSWEA